MRQDIQFHPGESITSRYFSKLISNYFDGLITIDPHLHRVHALSEIYSIPATALHATDCIGEWIRTNIPDGILIGPDTESSQWVSEIAHAINMPFTILDKIRYGDDRVDVSLPNIKHYQSYTPILVDDIISTAATMIETVHHLQLLRMKPPICIGVHALFSGQAYEALRHAGAASVITCNTIEHASNQIDVADMIVNALSQN
jgi:ribose-phosphate pyrophosphokinase